MKDKAVETLQAFGGIFIAFTVFLYVVAYYKRFFWFKDSFYDPETKMFWAEGDYIITKIIIILFFISIPMIAGIVMLTVGVDKLNKKNESDKNLEKMNNPVESSV